jgi:hypothetical protein
MSYARSIKNYIRSTSIVQPDEVAAIFLDKFKEKFKEHLIAVILYGSCLHPSTRKPTSSHDFYIVLDTYSSVLPNFFHSIINRALPPNVYYIQLKRGESHIEAKYNTITLKDLERETTLSAGSFFTLGRFGKKLGVLYLKEGYENRIIDCMYNAMLTNAHYTLAKMNTEFTLKEFILSLLALSYEGEVRIERDTKTLELFEAFKDFYTSVYSRILAEFSVHTGILIKTGENYKLNFSPEELEIRKHVLGRFIKKSRRLSVMRWPKSIYTFGNYVDYLLLKVERSKGIKIELTPLERRFPLIFGWRHFFRLLRKGMIK